MSAHVNIQRKALRAMREDILSDFVRSEPEAAVAVIMALAARITRETPHDVFISYQGHVNTLSVDIVLGGWKHRDSERTDIGDVHVDDAGAMDMANIIRRLQDVLAGDMDTPSDSTPIKHAINQIDAGMAA